MKMNYGNNLCEQIFEMAHIVQVIDGNNLDKYGND